MAGNVHPPRDHASRPAETSSARANSSNATHLDDAANGPSSMNAARDSNSISPSDNGEVLFPKPARRRSSYAEQDQYDVPDEYARLDEIAAPGPVENVTDGPVYRHTSLEQSFPGRLRIAPNQTAHGQHKKHEASKPQRRRSTAVEEERYTVPDHYANLHELSATVPVENISEGPIYRHASLEQARSRERDWRRESVRLGLAEEKEDKSHVSRLATKIYTVSYLVFFALMGTLARVGLTALTHYAGTPVTFTSIWANFGGCFVMGFLAEDRMLFRHEWGIPVYDRVIAQANGQNANEENGSGSGSGNGSEGIDLEAAKKAHLATKKSIPLYIGLATGFCGSFTSFSSFIRDIFLAMVNDIVDPGFGTTAVSRNGGYSFMAMLAVIITTVGLSLSGLMLGAHFAIATEPIIPSIPYPITRKVLDPLVVLLGWGCWLGAVLMAIFPPHNSWRGQILFALIFAPLGCLSRFYLALYLNGRMTTFPLGTFAANVIGTAVLGMAWDVAHVPSGGIIGCQVLQGIEDGFCGCLTTVSTWVAELHSLRRKNSYIYGTTSVVVSFSVMVAIMGGLKWTDGWSVLLC